MHVPRIETRTLDETVEAVDLGQTPADIVFLSFSDSDLNALARAYDAFPEPKPTLEDRFARGAAPSLLGRSLSREGVRARQARGRARARRARTIGATASMNSARWRAGARSSWRCCRGTGAATRASTRPRPSSPARSSGSGAISTRAALRIWRHASPFSPTRLACAAIAPPPVPVSAFGRFDAACFEAGPGAARALIVFYRSIYLANDLAPIEALARALRDKGLRGDSVFVTSLKDEAALAPLARLSRPAALRRRAQRHRLFRSAGRGRGNGARRSRRAGLAGRAGRDRASRPGAPRSADLAPPIWR